MPLVRLLGPNGPQLVNARQYLNVVIVDHLVARAELRVGLGEQAETVTITRGALRTIACPGDAADHRAMTDGVGPPPPADADAADPTYGTTPPGPSADPIPPSAAAACASRSTT